MEGSQDRGNRPFSVNEKGQVLVLLAIVLAMLFSIAALAVDVGMAYVVKTKLKAAVDAAALAAGRVVAAQDGSAAVEAEKFFDANYPRGLLGAAVDRPKTEAVYNHAEKTWTVTVSTKATVPTYFAKVIDWDTLEVAASATSTINPVDLVLILDASSSLGPPTSPSDTLPKLQAAATRFVSLFNPKNDRVGLIYFASGAVEEVKITAASGHNRKRMTDAIADLESGGYTTSEEALRLAKKQLDDVPVDLRAKLRVIVFFADGAPNGVAATFDTTAGKMTGALSSQPPVPGRLYAVDKQNVLMGEYEIGNLPGQDWTNTVSLSSYNNMRSFDTAGSAGIPYTNCNLNKAARNMVENIGNAARSESGPSVTPINIFTVGLGTNLDRLEIACPGYGNSEFGSNIMMRLANVPGVDTYTDSQPTGIYAFAADSNQLDEAFGKIGRAILRLSK